MPSNPSGDPVPTPKVPSREGGGQRGESVSQSYRGLPIYAASGLHEACFDMVGPRLERGASCLELGTGSGAFALRMADAGYRMQVGDADPAGFQAKDIPLWTLDLNRPLPEALRQESFDLVIALEVIEHLRDPIGFLENCRALCKPGGLVLLSTPNTVDPISSYLYLKRAEYLYFSRSQYRDIGHITLLPFWLLEAHLEQVGLEILQRRAAGRNHPRKARIAGAFQWVIQRVLGSQVPAELCSGDCIAYLLRNPSVGTVPDDRGASPK